MIVPQCGQRDDGRVRLKESQCEADENLSDPGTGGSDF